jgi:hypothetical protein
MVVKCQSTFIATNLKVKKKQKRRQRSSRQRNNCNASDATGKEKVMRDLAVELTPLMIVIRRS